MNILLQNYNPRQNYFLYFKCLNNKGGDVLENKNGFKCYVRGFKY